MPPVAPEPQTQLRLRALTAALSGRGICVLHQAADHRFDLAEHLPAPWGQSMVLQGLEADFMDETLAVRYSTAVSRCLKLREQQDLEFELLDSDRTNTYQARILPDGDGVLAIISDVTAERSREAALTALLREVSHRSKNLLAIVQSVAMQTAHHSEDVENFLGKFRGRLHALSSTQDLVTESNWQGTHLHDLVTSQLARVGQIATKKVRLVGENPLLSPNASLHLGLAIHELASNAMLHGGLAEGKRGAVMLHASLEGDTAGTKALIFHWHETGTGALEPHRAPRFGTLVLERIVPLSVAGAATYAIGDDTVDYRLTVPADQFGP